MIAVRTPSLITNTLPLPDVSLIRISLPGPSIMKRGRRPAKSMNSSTTNPGGAVSAAPSGRGTIVGLLRADGVANGSGRSFQFTGLRPRCADNVVAAATRQTSATAVRFIVGYSSAALRVLVGDHEQHEHDDRDENQQRHLPRAVRIASRDPAGVAVDH